MAAAGDLQGKVALVTGAARGIGKGISLALARAGADVVLSDLEAAGAGVSYDLSGREELEAAAKEVGQFGHRVLAHPCDVTHAAQARELVTAALESFGRLDVLVNNAGVVHFESLVDFEEEHWQHIFDVNVKGVFLISKAAIPSLVETRGAIVNISSVAGKRGYIGGSAYCGSKFAVVGITQALAAELAPQGVRVNAVCPGIISTAMWTGHLNAVLGERAGVEGEQAYHDAVRNLVPLGREQTAEDIAEAVLYLAQAPNVTGVSLAVAGGMEF